MRHPFMLVGALEQLWTHKIGCRIFATVLEKDGAVTAFEGSALSEKGKDLPRKL